MPPVLILLLHGTWAAKADWTGPGSHLRRNLKRELIQRGAPEVRFARTIWSGANTDDARIDASERLQKRLEFVTIRYPDHDIYLVGHSHGGNVVLHALLRREALRSRVKGVATLATPFLHFEKRGKTLARLAATLQELRTVMFMFAALAVAALVFIPLVVRLFPWFFEFKLATLREGRVFWVEACSPITTAERCMVMVTGTVATLGLASGLTLFGGMVISSWEAAAETVAGWEVESRKVVERTQYFQPESRLADLPILCLSAPIDEALQVMNGAWWLHRLAILTVKASVVLSVLGGAVTAAVGLWLHHAWTGELLLSREPTVPDLIRLTIGYFVAVPLFFAAGASLGWILRLVGRLPAPVFGGRITLANLLWNVRASHLPFIGRNVTSRSFGIGGLLREGKGLVHSRLYGSRAAAAELAGWMAGLSSRGRAG